MAQVKPRLEHIQNDLMNNFHRLGVLAKPLDGTERLRLMLIVKRGLLPRLYNGASNSISFAASF